MKKSTQFVIIIASIFVLANIISFAIQMNKIIMYETQKQQWNTVFIENRIVFEKFTEKLKQGSSFYFTSAILNGESIKVLYDDEDRTERFMSDENMRGYLERMKSAGIENILNYSEKDDIKCIFAVMKDGKCEGLAYITDIPMKDDVINPYGTADNWCFINEAYSLRKENKLCRYIYRLTRKP